MHFYDGVWHVAPNIVCSIYVKHDIGNHYCYVCLQEIGYLDISPDTLCLQEIGYLDISPDTLCLQEIGWFDEKENQVGTLTSRLANDASRVKGVSLKYLKGYAFGLDILFITNYE